jgi:hypothetical protein
MSDVGVGDGGITFDDVVSGGHAITTVAEVMEIFGLLGETLGPWVSPVGWLLEFAEMIIHMVQAFETEQRGAGYRGTSYGMLYGALGMGTPSHTCESDQGDDQTKLDQDSWDKGASEGMSKMGDTASRNRVMVRIAYDGGHPQTTLNYIFQALCKSSDDDILAKAYDSLPWPGPA